MIGRKLSLAAKQLLSSSSIQRGLFHTSNTPAQALKLWLLSAQKKASARRSSGSVAGAPSATCKPPPRALVEAPEELISQKVEQAREKAKSQEPKDCDAGKKALHRTWRPPRHVVEDVEEKKKKKKRAPPGPIEFESLTSTSPVHSNLPFAFRYSYTEIPKIPAVGFQEKYSPFGPGRLDRVWDGQQALPASSSSPSAALSSSSTPSENSVLNMKKSKYSFKGVRLINPPNPQLTRTHPKKVRTREEVLGDPLTPEEAKVLVENASKHKTRRQINMGRDGLTHNMLIEIQEHWKREPVVRIRCKGLCTVDMDNVHFQLEVSVHLLYTIMSSTVWQDKTGGKIIERLGGTLYLFRGRNFRFKDRPIIPPMLWKPHAPLYPKLIGAPPGGLKFHEALTLRKRGLKIMRLCILSKNAYYGDLVQHVKDAFEDDELVRIDSKRLNTSDYKKIGAKLRDLVPCYLLSFDKEQIILWRGRDKIWPNKRLENANESNGEHVEDGGGSVPMVAGEREDLSSIKSGCEDAERCHFHAYVSDNSDEEAISNVSSDEEAKKSAYVEESDEDATFSAFSEESDEDAKSLDFSDESDEECKSSSLPEEIT